MVMTDVVPSGEALYVPWHWILLPTVGALIGWLTNWVAVRMLFRPRKPWRLPLIGFEIQGVLPRRHAQLARIIGETVERDLLSADTLVEVIRSGNYRSQALGSIQEHLEARLGQVVPRFIPPGLQGPIVRMVKEWVLREADSLLDHVEGQLTEHVRKNISVAQLVEDRIRNFDLDELERMVARVASTELRYIEVIGGVLGGVIGLIQVTLLSLLQTLS